MIILDEFIEDEIFTESDWFEENEAPMFNISILDIYKKADFIDDNNISLSESHYIFLMIQGIAIS